jgi:hypothetical protein
MTAMITAAVIGRPYRELKHKHSDLQIADDNELDASILTLPRKVLLKKTTLHNSC